MTTSQTADMYSLVLGSIAVDFSLRSKVTARKTQRRNVHLRVFLTCEITTVPSVNVIVIYWLAKSTVRIIYSAANRHCETKYCNTAAL